MKTVRSAIRQAIFSKDFLIGWIGVIFVVLVSSVPDVFEALRAGGSLPNAFHHSLIEKAIASDAMTLALPILAALPFTASFVNDQKSGFIKYYLHRTDRKHYMAGKGLACWISGGSVLVLGLLASYVFFAVAFLPMEDPAAKEVGDSLFSAGLMRSLVLVFLSGAFWSLCGITLAAMSGSRYMAYASPFIVYYVLIILHERYFDQCYFLYPKEWIHPSSRWMLGEWGVILLLLGLTAALAAVFFCTVKRRISQL
ncbi:MAG: hypothetical protein J5496_00760 [Lachnospiraceae bacterium]|nr:hypothetical protein [Lachnospiraceae bacterium]